MDTTESGPEYVVVHKPYSKEVTILRRHRDGCYTPYAHMDDCAEAKTLARHLNAKAGS